jgi:hypothetical protein
MHMAMKKNICEEHLTEWLKLRGNKKRRGEMNRMIASATGMHVRSVGRAMKSLQLQHPLDFDQRGRSVYYTADVTAALREVWDSGDEMCGELLHPQIAEFVAIFKRDDEWKHSDEATGKLLAMSERTMKHRVSSFEKIRGRQRGLSATKPSALKSIIPIFKGPWKELPPGHEQIDTVAHCGHTLLGDFVYTLNATDACSYWCLSAAQWNKGAEATVASLKDIEARVPFPALQYHPDTGSEFINWIAKKYCDEHGIILSRSEPNKKNDNMYIEERNGHVVRKYFGYRRFDCPNDVSLMNDFYQVLDQYLNHFKPVRRQTEKVRVGAKYVRKYERLAKTPYQRVLEHPAIEKRVKDKLRAEHATLNPAHLKKEMDRLLKLVNDQQDRHDHRLCGCR